MTVASLKMASAADILAQHARQQQQQQQQQQQLSCDSNLIPLVIFLFLAGYFLFSSLKTGVQTTRVVVRLARDGCRDGAPRMGGASRAKLSGLKQSLTKRPSAVSAVSTVSVGFQWAKACVTLGGSSVGLSQRFSRMKRSLSHPRPAAPQPPLPAAARLPATPLVLPLACASTALPQWSPVKLALLKNWMPYRLMSRVWGLATRIPLPFYWLKFIIYQGWATSFNCKLDEMALPLEAYPTLCHFFLRPLRDGVRQIDRAPRAMVSPVDGKVLHCTSAPLADFDKVVLEQVKGVSYRLKDLIGEAPAAWRDAAATAGRQINSIVLYLSPGDYHHFHSSCEATFVERKHFPGALLPVKPIFAQEVQGLYCINERVVLNGSWNEGYFGYVAVGALNVGSIELTCDPELVTNVPGKRDGCFTRTFEKPVAATRGERLGAFNLGSTIVLVFESDTDFEFQVGAEDIVTVGQRLDVRSDAEEATAEEPMLCPPWPAAVSQ